MTKEWQEATNEYAKVRDRRTSILVNKYIDADKLAERAARPYLGYFQRGLLWKGLRAEPAVEQLRDGLLGLDRWGHGS